MFWTVILSSITAFIIGIYLYIKWKYYTLRGPVPGLQPEFLVGNLRQLGIMTSNKEMIDSTIHGCEKLQKLYGDIFQYWIGSSHYYVFCRPEHAQQIYADRNTFDRPIMRTKTFGLIAGNTLTTLIGPAHKRRAKIVSPMLKKHKFIAQIPIMTSCVDQLIDVWKKRYENKDNTICTCIVSDNQHLILDMFGLLTFDYDFGNLKHLLKTATSASSTEDKSELSDLGRALSVYLDAFKRVTVNGMPLFINYYLLKFDKKYQNAFKTLEYHAEKIILKCQEETHSDDKPVNLIASLVSSLQKDETLERSKRKSEKTGITKRELLEEVLSLTLSGFETTSTFISWFIYYVSKNPETQQKMKEALQRNGITKETYLDNMNLLKECEYIECVIKEVLRIAPILLGSFRTLLDNTIIDGVKIRKGETILSPSPLMQRDLRYWKLDPTQFIPERFYGPDAPDVNHDAFVFAPFGGGHRACVGQELARLEMKVFIIRLMQFVTFVDAPGNNGGYRQHLTTMPREMAVTIKFD